MKNKILCYLLFVICYLSSVPLFAENEFSFRIAPAVEAPFNRNVFNTGMGAKASLDWAFLEFANKFNFGANAGGSVISLPVLTGDPLNLIEGNAGLFLRYRPFDRWAFFTQINGGIYQYSRAGENDVNLLGSFLLGADFHLSPYISLFVDGSYTYRVFSTEPLTSFKAALGLKLNLSEIMSGRSRVRVEKTEQYRVFPVSWAWYENNPVAAVRITNEEPNVITDINLSFFMESFMSQPWIFRTVPRLAAGESIDVPVTALFNEAMLNLTENINANGRIQMQYRSLGARKTSDASIQMPIYHRNTLSWDDDRRAAAFVSPYDFAARYFAKYVDSTVNSTQLAKGNIPSNVVKAAALFEALRLYGINYIVVPATSFVNVSSDESVLDNVSYPYQALYYRGGDCSYLSILFCSMLETLGIESAFITIPGHIYIAFEIGSATWNAGNADIIEIDADGVQKRWLPVEITIPGDGFNRAWIVGARQWRNSNSLEEARLYPIREAWKVYPSVTVPASGDHLPEMPQWNDILRATERELTRR